MITWEFVANVVITIFIALLIWMTIRLTRYSQNARVRLAGTIGMATICLIGLIAIWVPREFYIIKSFLNLAILAGQTAILHRYGLSVFQMKDAHLIEIFPSNLAVIYTGNKDGGVFEGKIVDVDTLPEYTVGICDSDDNFSQRERVRRAWKGGLLPARQQIKVDSIVPDKFFHTDGSLSYLLFKRKNDFVGVKFDDSMVIDMESQAVIPSVDMIFFVRVKAGSKQDVYSDSGLCRKRGSEFFQIQDAYLAAKKTGNWDSVTHAVLAYDFFVSDTRMRLMEMVAANSSNSDLI